MNLRISVAAARLARTFAASLSAIAILIAAAPLKAEPLPVVASFSILGDLVKQVGGDAVAVGVLVGPEGDAHVFSPAPQDAKRLAAAKLIVVNGLGLEGWFARLIKASGTKAPVLVASNGVSTLKEDSDGGQGHRHDHGNAIDPHAWQAVSNTEIYVGNIRDGLIKADPQRRADYEARAAAYIATLKALDTDIKADMASLPAERRRIITTHDAFGYFAKAYGLTVIAPQGVSTEAEASAKDVARVIQQIRRDKVPAVFLENVSDPRLMDRVAAETGAKIGGKLYSDALSPSDGPAATYDAMMRSNLRTLVEALKPRS